MLNQLAQGEINLGNQNLEGEGVLANQAHISDAFGSLNNLLTVVVGILSVVAAVYFVFLIFTGAYNYLSAGADKSRLEDARQKILSGIVGIVIVVAAIFIADLIGFFIGINFLSPGDLLNIGP